MVRIAIPCSVVGFAIAIVFAPVSAHSAASDASHCRDHEQIWFNCSAGSKIVSVCAARGSSNGAASVQYRFGPPRAPELVYPAARGNWRAVTRGGVLTLAGGGGAYLAFTRAPYRYLVYTAIGRGWGEKAGVAVEKAGRRIANVTCTAKETSELGPDLFAKERIAEDATGFDLP